jgi:hypothetical protein
MMLMTRCSEMPDQLRASLSDISCQDLERWIGITPYIFKMSKECYYVTYKETPLLVVGAAQLTFLDPARELWLYGSRNLHFAFLPTLKEMFTEWRLGQSGPMYARANTPRTAKFMKYFGMRLAEVQPDGIEVYEV